jgi:DNA-binding NarL/FixJ family response regulator
VICVVVAEDNLLVREGLRSLLDSQEEVTVVGDCADYDSLLATVEQVNPDVVVTDIRMPPTGTDEGVRAARQFRRTHPRMGVIVLSQYTDSGYAVALMEDGSDRRAYLLKERMFEPAQLLSAIRQVNAGHSVVDPAVVDALLNRRRTESPLEALTVRETEILREIAQGLTNAAIGKILYISEKSVQKHIGSIFAKLGLVEDSVSHRRVQAVLVYLNAQ